MGKIEVFDPPPVSTALLEELVMFSKGVQASRAESCQDKGVLQRLAGRVSAFAPH